MNKINWMLPALLAGMIVAAAFGFVAYYNNYEGPGEHWAPASPIAHETARFGTDMGDAGDYRVIVEKISSKFPLLFVEYQTPGNVLDMTIHSDDGIVHFAQQFADEGHYRVTIQQIIQPDHTEVVDFTVQTPLVKYTNDVLLFLFLLAAGFLSGKRLRALAVVCLMVSAAGFSMPNQAMAHGIGGEHQSHPISNPTRNQAGEIVLQWFNGKAPLGQANRVPMDWSMRISRAGEPVARAPFTLDVVHSETHHPVLHIEGVANQGVIQVKYSPPDGTDYEFQVRTVIDGHDYHLSLPGSAEAIPPTSARKWASFLIMMVPLLIGMGWGWKRG